MRVDDREVVQSRITGIEDDTAEIISRSCSVNAETESVREMLYRKMNTYE